MKSIKEFVEEFEEAWLRKYPMPQEGQDILMCPHYMYASYESSPCRECLVGALEKRESSLIASMVLK